MPGEINLIAKIIPKNAAFIGMVDSDQVLSTSPSGHLVGYGATVLEDSGVVVASGYVVASGFIGDGSRLTGLTDALAYNVTFLVADWLLNLDYYINIPHSLNTYNPVVSVRDSTDSVSVHREEIVDNNNIRIWVPSSPDLRFAGKISVTKT